MNHGPHEPWRPFERAIRVVTLLWAVASALTATWALAKTEYARTAAEARAVAASVVDGVAQRSPTRELIAAGNIRPVTIQMERVIGSRASRLALEDAARVHATWKDRYVSVPVKDTDDWDIIGAVVLRARWLRHAWWAWLIPLTAAVVAAVWGRVAARRVALDPQATPLANAVECMAALSVGAALLIILTRRQLVQGATLAPPAARFDPLVLSPAHPQVVAALLAALFVSACGAAVAVLWFGSVQRSADERRTNRAAWGFLAPSALHLLAFTVVPLLFTLYVSLHRWDLVSATRPFVGLRNYLELFSDPLFWNALKNTALYSLYVPVTMAVALGVALVLNQPLRGMRVVRAIVFLPTIVSYVAIAMAWQWIYHADYGVLNYVIRSMGGTGVDWLGNPRTALIALMVVSAWVQVGYQMIVYLAGLQGIPPALVEAAQMDGAGRWQRFRHLVWPLLRPVSVYLLMTGVVWSFQVFGLVYVMTEGGPVRSTDVLVYQIYQHAWEFRRMGYASAMSWVLCALLGGLTYLQWKALNRRVDYVA